MIEIKNQFVRHSMFWAWVLPFALFLLLPAFVDREEMHIPAAELQMMQEVLGQDVDAITHRADHPEALQGFDLGGYGLDAAASSRDRWVFRRRAG